MTPTERDRAWARLDAIGDLIKHLQDEQAKLAGELSGHMRTIPDGTPVTIYGGTEVATVLGSSLLQVNGLWHVHYLCKFIGREKWLNVGEEHVNIIPTQQP